jgi:putative MATE family efflux protein
VHLRSAYDREILRLAVPALGALAAEPLYVLADTAIVGHLGRSQLAALGAASTVLAVLAMFNFLQYATTAQVARATGAKEDVVARQLGAQAFWLSLAIGLALAGALAALAPQVVSLVGVEGGTADYAETYLRIVALGVPSFFLALSGQGFLRGRSELTAPLVVIVLGNVLNVALEVMFVYGFGWGIEGSAWGTAIAQTCMGAGFVWLIVSRAGRRHMAPVGRLTRRLLSVGKFIFIRTFALISAFVLSGAVVARFGDAELAAYQISFQLFLFLALALTRSRSPARSSSGASSERVGPSGHTPRACG